MVDLIKQSLKSYTFCPAFVIGPAFSTANHMITSDRARLQHNESRCRCIAQSQTDARPRTHTPNKPASHRDQRDGRFRAGNKRGWSSAAGEIDRRRDACEVQQRHGWEMTARCCTVIGGRRPLSQHPEPPPLPRTATFTPCTLRLRCSHSNKMQRGGGRCAREEVCRRLGRNFAAAAAWIRPICCSGFKILSFLSPFLPFLSHAHSHTLTHSGNSRSSC